jgi:hypothetical protein
VRLSIIAVLLLLATSGAAKDAGTPEYVFETDQLVPATEKKRKWLRSPQTL